MYNGNPEMRRAQVISGGATTLASLSLSIICGNELSAPFFSPMDLELILAGIG